MYPVARIGLQVNQTKFDINAPKDSNEPNQKSFQNLLGNSTLLTLNNAVGMAFNYEKLYLNFLVNYHDFYFANVKMKGYTNNFDNTTSGLILTNTTTDQNKSFSGVPKKFKFEDNVYFTIDVGFVF